ncbi:uncharacterized protein F13E9.13, mitochondrial-like isoform 2-T3 [Vipera latastei]
MQKFLQLFGRLKSVVLGMVHVQALPGTPCVTLPLAQIIEAACREAEMYRAAGVDGLIVENMHDRPYTFDVGAEVTAAMAVICASVKQACPTLPIGVQILSAANQEALAVALASAVHNFLRRAPDLINHINLRLHRMVCSIDLQKISSIGADFVRVEGFVFSHVADEGILNACAGNLLRYRKQIGAEHIQVFADIKKKHSAHALTADVTVAETAKAAEFFLADGVVLTGTATGSEADPKELEEVRSAVKIPVLVGSGVTLDNVKDYLSANALIIGSYFKKDGYWANGIDLERVKRFLDYMGQVRV